LFVVSILSDSDVLFEDSSVVELSCFCFGLLNADGPVDTVKHQSHGIIKEQYVAMYALFGTILTASR
jgi:hypothetical protein